MPIPSDHRVYGSAIELIEEAKRNTTPQEVEKLMILPIQVGIGVVSREDETLLVGRAVGAMKRLG